MYPRAERVLKWQRRSCECRSGETVLPFVLRRERVFEVERDRSRERALARLRALKKPLPKGFRFDRDEAKPLRQMRILLDENFPADFATLLAGHDTSNVHSHGWAGIKNGELLRPRARRMRSICNTRPQS